MKRLTKHDEDSPQAEITMEDVRGLLAQVGDEYGLPELAAAYDAVTDAMSAVEGHEKATEIMQKLFQAMQPLAAQAPALLMKMGMF